jgi:arylsulfatase
VDQAGGLALGRHPQRHDRALAQRIAERGGLRSQFTHVIDVAPTILEAAGLPEPTMVNGVQQSPMEGASMLYTFEGADAPERHDLQYFEMFGNRGIYHRGWSAVTKHRTPWVMVGGAVPAFDDDIWELYDGHSDYSQAHDLVADRPRDARHAAAALAHRGHQVQRAPHRRPVAPSDSNPRWPGGPTLIHGKSQAVLPRPWAVSRRTAWSASRTSRSRSPPEIDVPDHRS